MYTIAVVLHMVRHLVSHSVCHLKGYLLHESNFQTPYLACFELLTSILIETLPQIKLRLTLTFSCLQVNLLLKWLLHRKKLLDNLLFVFTNDARHENAYQKIMTDTKIPNTHIHVE